MLAVIPATGKVVGTPTVAKTAQKIISPVATATKVSTTPTVSDLLANPGLSSVTVQTSLAPLAPVAAPVAAPSLPQSVPLTGQPNNPPTPVASNSPGLNTAPVAEEENPLKKHWVWIALIVVALLAFWYFYGGTSSTT